MLPSTILRAAEGHVHKPLIRFLGPRRLLNHGQSAPTASPSPSAGGSTNAVLVAMPVRFRLPPMTEQEMEAIDSGGASYILTH